MYANAEANIAVSLPVSAPGIVAVYMMDSTGQFSIEQKTLKEIFI